MEFQAINSQIYKYICTSLHNINQFRCFPVFVLSTLYICTLSIDRLSGKWKFSFNVGIKLYPSDYYDSSVCAII